MHGKGQDEVDQTLFEDEDLKARVKSAVPE
jgi:hypothetical protein